MSESRVKKNRLGQIVLNSINKKSSISDTAVEDFYLRGIVYLGDENLANIVDHEGAYIILEEDSRSTIGGGVEKFTPISTTENNPTAITIVTRRI